MKKIVFIISMVSFGLGRLTGYAQDETQTTTTTTTTTTTAATPTVGVVMDGNNEHFKRGYIGGMVLATFADIKLKTIDDHTIQTSTTMGWGGGGMVGYYFSKNVNLELDVLYSSLSQKYKSTYNTDDRLNISYINIPLLIGLNTDASKPVNINICAGPQLGLNVGSSIETTHVEHNVDTVNAILSVKKGDVGIAFGAGIDFRIAETLKLSFGYRGVRGIVDISDQSQTTTTHDYYILDRSHVNTNSAYAGLAVLF